MNERIACNSRSAWTQTPGWRNRGFTCWAFWFGLALSLSGVASVDAQITTISQGSQLSSPQIVGSMPDPYNGPRQSDPVLEQQRIQAIKLERRAQMLSDTNKLLKLTARLNTEIEQSHANALTNQQLRMLAKIEKLAKRVKENMSTPIPGLTMDQAAHTGGP